MAAGVFLTDFGLAKALATGSGLTRTGETLGTPAYMSPELARGQFAALTPAADVWALACVLHECCAGRPAFGGDTPAAVIGAVLAGARTPLPPGLPPAVQTLVDAGLRAEPVARYRDAAALREDAARVLAGRPPAARRPRPRARWLAGGAVLGATGAVLAAVLGGAMPETASPAAGPSPPSGTEARAAVLVERARRRLHDDLPAAERLLADAVALAPDRHDWRLAHGRALWGLHRNPEARAAWAAIPAGAPEWPAAQLHRGLVAMFAFEEHEARAAFAAAADAAGPAARLAAGALAQMRGDWAGARAALRGEAGWEAALLRGVLEDLDPAGDPAQAIREYESGLAGGQPFVWVHTNLAVLRNERGDHAAALAHAEAALRLAPRGAKPLAARGVARAELGDLPNALADLTAALDVEPDDWRARANRSAVQLRLGEAAGAAEDAAAAAALAPRSALAHHNLGTARLALGDLEVARREFDEALALDPGYTDARMNRALARRRLGDPRGALEDLDAVVAQRPADANARFNRGNARRECGDLAGAIDDWAAAIGLDARHAEAHANLGIARYLQQDWAGAAALLGEALRLAPGLANAATLQGFLDEARQRVGQGG